MLNLIGYSAVIVVAAVILGGMFMVVRLATEDSDKQSWVREIVESMFGTPAHLRPAAPENKNAEDDMGKSNSSALETFEEPCPACGERVTQAHEICPSCDLRLQ
ncbi:hypothetical protein SY83_12685 [Paenibacillus swuensis]|uniref:Uncharacterized protein n=1 Tax=Paenibacillus swuensis TaxID=1178515 RepID=A0A172TJ05_9BACL|nr:hypothetical protein [Paenibacillus swuensis]ANE46990.1 hypothetical protein SY83_12685 [Paenibacillus swuensis]